MRPACLVLAVLALCLHGCAAKRQTILAGDTAYEMQSSIIAVSERLTPAQREEFDQAISTIIFAATDRRLDASGDRLSPQAIRNLKGRTVRQVIESAKLMRSASAYRG